MNSRLTFFLADDDDDDIALFCEALTEIDPSIICHTAENGSQAFKTLSELSINRPQVIFLDINMPILNGWECLKRIKQHPNLENIPVIMYSTSSSKKDLELASALGAICMMTKPDNFLQLKEILKTIIDNFDNLPQSLKRLSNVKAQ